MERSLPEKRDILSQDSFFFELAHKTMCRLWANEITKEEGIIEDARASNGSGHGRACQAPLPYIPLSSEDHGAEQNRGFLERHESHQMHALILALLKQLNVANGTLAAVIWITRDTCTHSVNPSGVAAHQPKTTQMPD